MADVELLVDGKVADVELLVDVAGVRVVDVELVGDEPHPAMIITRATKARGRPNFRRRARRSNSETLQCGTTACKVARHMRPMDAPARSLHRITEQCWGPGE